MGTKAIRLAVCVAAACGIVVAGAVAAGRLADGDGQQVPAVQDRGGLPEGIVARLTARGNWRQLTVDDDAPDGFVAVPLDGTQEMLVSRIVVANGRFFDGTAETGGVTLVLGSSDAPGEPGFTFFPFSAYGSQEFTIDPPLPLRAGDEIRFGYATPEAPGGYVQVRLIGEAIPPTAFVAR